MNLFTPRAFLIVLWAALFGSSPCVHAAGPPPPSVVVYGANSNAQWNKSGVSSYTGDFYSYDPWMGSMTTQGSLTIDVSGSYAFSAAEWFPPYQVYTSGYYEYPEPYTDADGNWIYPDPIWHPEESYYMPGSWVGFTIWGDYNLGLFSTGNIYSVTTLGQPWPGPSPEYSTGNPVYYPPALWVNGANYNCVSDSASGPFHYYRSDTSDYYTLADGVLTSFIAAGNFSGTYTPNMDGGVFHLVNPATGTSYDAPDLRPLSASYGELTTTTFPAYGPFQLRVNGTVWRFQGTVLAEDFYMGAEPGQRLRIRSDGTVSLENRATGLYGNAGIYSYGVFQGLPEPVRTLDYDGQVFDPKPTGQGPASVIINGQVWYRSSEGGNSYDAYYGPQVGQILYLYGSAVWLSDAVNNLYTGGTYAQGKFQGLQASARAGDAEGGLLPVLAKNRQGEAGYVNTMTGDLDIYGNLLTLGTWRDNPANSGFSLGFTDLSPTGNSPASIGFLATRSSSQWIWARGTDDDSGVRNMMKLNASHELHLYPSNSTSAKIILNPGGRSRFEGPVRLAPQGDISMGPFTQGPSE